MPNGTSAFEEQYERGPILGRGASGVAFVVRPKKTPELQHVAKELCIARVDEKRRRDAFAESQMLRELSHPNIVRCIDVFQDDELMYIVMEYANGGDLSARIQARRTAEKRFSESTVMRVFVQICAALHHIHQRKIVHRDLKPPNVFVVGEGALETCTVKLGDFGIAKMIESTCGQAHSTVGTPSYLSPEICKNNPYGMKSDIWSLGIILYELACLKVPFHAGNLPAMALMICRDEPNPLPEEFGAPLGELVKLLLQKDPNKRPQVLAVLQHSYVNRQLPEDFRAEINAAARGGAAAAMSSTLTAAGGGLSTATGHCEAPELLHSSASTASIAAASAASTANIAGGGGSTGEVRRGSSQPIPGRGSRDPGARLPSCGPATRLSRHDKLVADEMGSWAWRRPSDGDRSSTASMEARDGQAPGRGKGRPTPRVEKEKPKDRERPRPRPSTQCVEHRGAASERPAGGSAAADHGGERDRERGDALRDDRTKRAERMERTTQHGAAGELRSSDHSRVLRSDRDPRGEQQHRLRENAERAAAALAAEQAVRCGWSATDAGGRLGGYAGSSLNSAGSGNGGRESSSAPAGSVALGAVHPGIWAGIEAAGMFDLNHSQVFTPETSGLADTDEDLSAAGLYHYQSSGLAGGVLEVNATSTSEVRPPAELMDPAPPSAEATSGVVLLTALMQGNSDANPRMRTRIRRRWNAGRPPLAGQEASAGSETGDVRSPTRQRPSARGLEAASSSPGTSIEQTLHSTAPIASVAAPLPLGAAARSVSPARKAAALREEQPIIPVVPAVLRASGSAPALPPLPPLVAPARGSVPRSRSVAGLQDHVRGVPRDVYEGTGPGRGYTELQRTAPLMFRTSPLPISSDRGGSGDSGSSANQEVRQGPPPPSLAPPPQQPPPPRQAARDDVGNAVRLAPKLPTAVVGQSENRHWRSDPGGREPPPVAVPAEGWGGDVDSRLASARLQSVV